MDPCSPLKLHSLTTDDARAEAGRLLEGAYQQVLTALGMIGYPVTTDENFADTAGRAARAMLEMVHPVDEIERELDGMLERTFAARRRAASRRTRRES